MRTPPDQIPVVQNHRYSRNLPPIPCATPTAKLSPSPMHPPSFPFRTARLQAAVGAEGRGAAQCVCQAGGT